MFDPAVLIARATAAAGPLLAPHSALVGARGPALPMPEAGPDRVAGPWHALGVVPDRWARVPGAEVATAAQRYAEFLTDRGRLATLHTVYGLDATPVGRPVALVTLGARRVAIEALATDRYAAQWSRGDAVNRLSMAPAGLGEFMDTLLRLDFTRS